MYLAQLKILLLVSLVHSQVLNASLHLHLITVLTTPSPFAIFIKRKSVELGKQMEDGKENGDEELEFLNRGPLAM